ncbi:hypothetical protein WQE_47384 [Paraburkholderia hospita]|uniref:Uncharacterized protein n=1 Tax=Paraburkholderia hospita TaxID=169430 RepID=A0ABN0F5J1_9BURK|nr:hypothetical protein WQE_47384 [Paraburkholderia hospita]OUL80674.1 hypothetical protein CA602_27320 [Paraburkholderia hospita]OUL96392.1 hypothetical protein CA601_02850 [Paraburkholderia hospita]
MDTSERAYSRLELALHLAKRFGAHLTGILSLGSAEYFESHEERRKERHGELEGLFHAELGRAGVSGEWIADGWTLSRWPRQINPIWKNFAHVGALNPEVGRRVILDKYPAVRFML